MTTNYYKLQENLAGQIKKGFSNYKKSPKERITLSYLSTRLETLEEQWKEFTSIHRKIVYEADKSEFEASSYFKDEIFDETEECFIDYKSLLKDQLLKIKPEQTPTATTSTNNECNKQNIKLPKINIPTFSGDYMEWPSFRDSFRSLIHKQSCLDNVQKLHYLKGFLSGEAEQLLRHYKITSDNYVNCWSVLEKRYNNKRYLVNCYLKKLLGQKPLIMESSSAIKFLSDTTSECLIELQNLGVDVSSWDVILIYLLSEKLDPESRKLWEKKVTKYADELPSMTLWNEFLENRYRSTEYKDPQLQNIDRASSQVITTATVSCSFCHEGHKLANCKKFSKQTIDERRNFVQTQHVCFNCLNSDHSVYQCKIATRCRLCQKKHHTLLHPKNTNLSNETNKTNQSVGKSVVATVTASTSQTPPCDDDSSSTSDDPDIKSYYVDTPSQVLLATALVNVEPDKIPVVLRSLLDQGSQASFVTESAVQMLGLKKVEETNYISGLGGDPSLTCKSKAAVFLTIQSRLDPNFTISVKAYVLSKLTCFLPRSEVRVLPVRLSSSELADPSFGVPNRIDLLLGAEVYSQILLKDLLRDPSGLVVAQKTRLGWILSGRVPSPGSDNPNRSQNHLISMHTAEPDNELLKRFWEMEAEPSHNTKHLTLEEQRCEKLFSQTTHRDESGRYIVRLPFKSNDPPCKYGNSRVIARKRFLTLERRLLKDPYLKAEYSKVIQEYLDMGHMEAVNDRDNAKAVYLPHHAVVRQDKTTSKVRIVFDASCSGSNGVSLNNDLMTGPTLQPELRHLIMRWRCYPIALVADIVKMYRQIKVADADVDFQRIYWRENPGEELQHLRLLRVTFGTTSAPFLAVRTLQQLARDEGAKFTLAAERVLNEFYMDDLMSGCYSVAEGVRVHEQMKQLLILGGFPLQKWASNNKNLMNSITEGKDSSVTEMEIKSDEVLRILGVTWHREADEFQCTVKLAPVEHPITKRRVVSDIARLFDPLGWMAPVITTAKVFIQRLWLSGIGWDSELPAPLLESWLKFRNNLHRLAEIRIPRWIYSGKSNKVFELHGFSDASNVGFAAVVYARIIDPEGQTHVSLVTSKTKVAPIKQVSIPRLELCGAVLLAKLINEVADILSIPKQNLHAWTDSSIVLAWLSNHPSRWKTFVANRVSEILSLTEGNQWSHVASKENPADPASRGIQPSELVDLKLWNDGPEWLHLKKINYSKGTLIDTNLEERKIKVKAHTLTCVGEGESFLKRFSSLRRLVRVLAWCRRVYLPRHHPKPSWLTATELQNVMVICIKLCQDQYFAKDLENKKGKFASLNPFRDVNDIWRVGGRLQRSDLNEDRKHPIMIPRQSHLAKLIIANAHERTLHGGPMLTINYIHTKYWIVNLRNLVKSYIHKCVTCIRYSSQIVQPLMGQLPPARVTADKPFRQSGVDYAGPIAVRTTKGRGHRSTKGYICLFICMVTRAIHLEVVSDLTSEAFLAAFKRFIARRGHCADLWSDNGTTFVGADRELKILLGAERSSFSIEIADWLATNGTTWHRIPAHSPNFGGLWEAGIKSTKGHLKRVIGTSTLTFEELSTVLAQIEACLNSRPITRYSDSSAEDPFPLTPGHFLIGEPLILVPDHNYEASNISSLKRWQLTQRMVQSFWRRWSREYLTQFLQRYKWKELTSEPEIGDVVLVMEDDLPPARWLFGVVTEKHTGLDKVTRVVSLLYKGNTFKRPVSKLVRLPVTN